ncbi:MAG: type I-C CRISPR-associated protein Cas8c/Csd1, partial [Thermomicrobiales bacterium]|nr:type I-C CRISPR-associated protein Cas8c/Csd1 [Thermomicrobiales bacterium]
MLLQELCALAQCDADQPPPMYQKATIRYLISLRADGSMVGNLRDVSTATQDNTKRGISVFAPHVKRSSGIRPKLLADFSPYVLGIVLDNSKQARAEQQHAQFVELVNRCRDATQEPSVAAISTFLATFDPESLKSDLPKGFDPSGTITFEVGQERLRPIDLPSVRQFWATYTGVDDTDPSVPLFSCIVCNEERPALERHPIRIKGVPGGEKLKDLVSANRPAFLSYGLKASQVAPTCQSCAEAYANALNSLLADKRTSLQTNDGAYAFWTRADAEFAVSPLIVNPDEQQIKVKLLMESWKRGDVAALDFDLTPFYAVGLSGSGARLVINDWIDTSIGQAEHLLGRYFA